MAEIRSHGKSEGGGREDSPLCRRGRGGQKVGASANESRRQKKKIREKDREKKIKTFFYSGQKKYISKGSSLFIYMCVCPSCVLCSPKLYSRDGWWMGGVGLLTPFLGGKSHTAPRRSQLGFSYTTGNQFFWFCPPPTQMNVPIGVWL
jgi:hypothetical protein